MLDTLTNKPEDFRYFNNGITVLCDSAERRNWSRGTKGPVDVALKGASVVNGAQTVTPSIPGYAILRNRWRSVRKV